MNVTCNQCNEPVQASNEDIALPSFPAVLVKNATVHRCVECGDYEVEVPRMTQLVDAVALAVIRHREEQEGSLTFSSAEVEFLKQWLFGRHVTGQVPATFRAFGKHSVHVSGVFWQVEPASER